MPILLIIFKQRLGHRSLAAATACVTASEHHVVSLCIVAFLSLSRPVAAAAGAGQDVHPSCRPRATPHHSLASPSSGGTDEGALVKVSPRITFGSKCLEISKVLLAILMSQQHLNMALSVPEPI